MQNYIIDELQAPLGSITYGVGGGMVDLDSVLATARNNYVAYIKPPTGLSVSNNAVPAVGVSVQFSVNAGNVQPGPTLRLFPGDLSLGSIPPGNAVTSVYVPEDGAGNSQPYMLTFKFPVGSSGSTYSLQLSNPGTSYVYETFIVE